MEVFTKTASNGKTIELRIDGPLIEILVDGESKGTVGQVLRLDANLRRGLYRNAPTHNPRGEPLTHAVNFVTLTEPEGRRIEQLLEVEKERQARRYAEAEREKYPAEYARAKETGKPVAVGSYDVPCNDPREECNCDILTRWINPDGSFTNTRQHTW